MGVCLGDITLDEKEREILLMILNKAKHYNKPVSIKKMLRDIPIVEKHEIYMRAAELYSKEEN